MIPGDPSRRDFNVEGMRLPSDVNLARFSDRRELHRELDQLGDRRSSSATVTDLLTRHYESAMKLIEKSQAAQAFEIGREPESVRSRYGPTKFGQSLLMARRLVEGGIPLVTINWDDDSKADKVSPHWDTHNHAFRRLRETLCPVFDQALAAFVDDLHQRQLLDQTLVVVLGEFGRTPKIGLITQNGMTEKTGRDHWPHAFTALLAGGGVRGGQTYGATNSTGGYVLEKPVSPADLTATVLYHLGIDPTISYHDAFQRVNQRLCEGTPVRGLA